MSEIGDIAGKVDKAGRDAVGKGIGAVGSADSKGGQLVSGLGSKISGNQGGDDRSGAQQGGAPQGGPQQKQYPQIIKAVNDIDTTLKDVEDDVKNGPSDQLKAKLDKYNEAVANGAAIGDKALGPLYKNLDEAYKEGNQQAIQRMKQGVEGARHNWNGLLKSDEEAEEVVKQKLANASDKDKALLQGSPMDRPLGGV